MRKIFFLALLLLISGSYAYAGSVEFSTYYPAPFGMYDRLRLVPRAALTTEPCDAGAFYYETGVGLRLCDEATQTWGGVGGVWTQTGDNIYPSDTATNPNLRVGIGTTTPSSALSIESPSAPVMDLQNTNAASYSSIDFRSSADAYKGAVGYANTSAPTMTGTMFLGSSTGTDLIFFTDDTGAADGTERLRIKAATGNIGIGTTTPLESLHVGGLGDIRADDEFKVVGGALGDKGYTFVNDEDTAMFSPAIDTIAFGTAGVERMRITSGNVGIGTTTPTGKLTVVNNANTADLVIGNTDFARTRIDFLNDDTFNPPEARIQSESGGTAATLQFYTESSGVLAERMRIDYNGNVGIGTTSPASQLSFGGTAATIGMATTDGSDNASLRLAGAPLASTTRGAYVEVFGNEFGANYKGRVDISAGIGDEVSDVGDIVLKTSNTERMRVLDNGNVGIGTAAPTERLEVTGGNIKAGGGLIMEGRINNNPSGVNGQLWVCTDVGGMYTLTPCDGT